VNLGCWGRNLVRDFGWWGVVLLVLGGLAAWIKKTGFAFLRSDVFDHGPLFFFLAICRQPACGGDCGASYLIPDLVTRLPDRFGVELLAKSRSNLRLWSHSVDCWL